MFGVEIWSCKHVEVSEEPQGKGVGRLRERRRSSRAMERLRARAKQF